VFFLTNPMCYTMGKVPAGEQKPAFYDATVSLVHPILGLFPHAMQASTSSYGGIAAGPSPLLGLPIGDLAVRYLLVGLVVILMRGIVTEIITTSCSAVGGARKQQKQRRPDMATSTDAQPKKKSGGFMNMFQQAFWW